MLVSSQTAVMGEHGFEIAVRMENLRSGPGTRYKIKAILCSKYALEIKLVFSCFYVSDIANIEIHTWIEYNKYHEMR